jgi:hypothetical protein
MTRMIRPYMSAAERAQIWVRWRAGELIWRIAQALARSGTRVRAELDRTGGISPGVRRRSPRTLSLAEREGISRGLVAQCSLRSIARRLKRSASSISREVGRHGGARVYRASRADDRAWSRARRPKACRLGRDA